MSQQSHSGPATSYEQDNVVNRVNRVGADRLTDLLTFAVVFGDTFLKLPGVGVVL